MKTGGPLKRHPESKVIELTRSLTKSIGLMGEANADAAKQGLQEAFPEFEILQHVFFEPPWAQDRISKSGMEFLIR